MLLDTNVLLWLYAGSDRLGGNARVAIEGADVLAVSVVSLWEIALKSSLGKLAADVTQVAARLRQDGVLRLDISDAHLAALATLPWLNSGHRDPFDRLLVCQAQVERLTLVTADRALGDYPVSTLDARG